MILFTDRFCLKSFYSKQNNKLLYANSGAQWNGSNAFPQFINKGIVILTITGKLCKQTNKKEK